MSPDPYKQSGGPTSPGSWNRYAYVGDDPINYNDPAGLASCKVVGTFTTNSDPDSGLTPVTQAEIQCTSIAGTGFVSELVAIPSTSSRDVQQAAKDAQGSIGADLDRIELQTFQALLSDATRRVQADLLKPDCAADFRNASAASTKTAGIGFSHQSTGAVAQYNPITRSINLARWVNWSSPDSTIGTINGVSQVLNLLGGNAAALGIPTMNAAQYMDLTILHELTHYNGRLGNPDKNPEVEKRLWSDCVK